MFKTIYLFRWSLFRWRVDLRGIVSIRFNKVFFSLILILQVGDVFKSPFSHRIPSQTRFLHRFCLHQDWCLCILTLGNLRIFEFSGMVVIWLPPVQVVIESYTFQMVFSPTFSSVFQVAALKIMSPAFCLWSVAWSSWLRYLSYLSATKKANLNVEWNKSLGVCIPIRRGICNRHRDYWNFSKGSIQLCTSAVETKSRKGEVWPGSTNWIFLMFHDDFVAGSIVTVSADISAITVVGLSGMLEDSGCLIGWLY